ncbi:MAG: MFS transporter [Dehalococcoidales bacterium]|nr:MFS transporter [Dehalococcoidales bacterium]
MVLFLLAHFSHHLISSLIQPLLPYIRDDFNLNYSQYGWVLSVFALTSGLSQLPGGWLSRRISPRILILAGTSGLAFTGLLIGLSPSYVLLMTFVSLMGILSGGYHPTAAPIVSASVPEEKRGQALGFHQMGGTISLFIGPLLAAGLSSIMDWRWTFITISIPIIIFGIVLYIILTRRGYTRKPEQANNESFTIKIEEPGGLRRLIAFIAAGSAVQIITITAISFVPVFYVDYFHGSKAVAAVLYSLTNLSGLFAGPIGGALSDRFGKIRILTITSLVAGPAIYLLSVVPNIWIVPIILLIAGICMYVVMPVTESYIISQTSSDKRSTVLGIYYTISRGGPIISSLIGGIIAVSGFNTAFGILGISLFLISLTATIFLGKNRN